VHEQFLLDWRPIHFQMSGGTTGKAIVTNACKLVSPETNGTRTKTYRTTADVTPADPVPTGLATNLYNASSVLHYSGQFTTKDTASALAVRVGQKLNITGGRSAWDGFNALITQCTYDWSRGDVDHGLTTITIGPPPHLTLGDLIDRVKNTRLIKTAPRIQRATGVDQTGNQLALPTQAPVQNTSEGPARRSFFVVDDPDTEGVQVQLDGPNQRLKIIASETRYALVDMLTGEVSLTDGNNVVKAQLSDSSNGNAPSLAITDGSKTITAALNDLGSGDTAKFRDTTLCIDGVEYTAKILRTEEVAA
jgi:hypothetical protein